MNYTFMIRRASVEDAPAVYAILQSAFKEYAKITGLDKLEALFETVDALIDGCIVGTLRLDIHGDQAYLSRFAVDNHNRNIGVGKSLMHVADKYLRHKGVKKVTLHTDSRHGALVRFYYSRGFFVEAIETDRGYLRARLVKEY